MYSSQRSIHNRKMTLDSAINTIMDAMFNTTFAGQAWLIKLAVIIASLVLITRVWDEWMILALPVMTGWKYFGIQIPIVFFVIGAILFVIGTLSTRILSGALVGMETIIRERSKVFTRKGRDSMKMKRYEKDDIERKVREKITKIRELGGLKEYKEEMKRQKKEKDLIDWTRRKRAEEDIKLKIKEEIRNKFTREKEI